jgi:NAD(P)-dependent dehydrogenase (short-subunit alcohol dehydrogenase family)
LARLGYQVIILIDCDEAALSKQKAALLKTHTNTKYKLKVYTIKYDLKSRQQEVTTDEDKLNCDVLKQIRALATKFSDK